MTKIKEKIPACGKLNFFAGCLVFVFPFFIGMFYLWGSAVGSVMTLILLCTVAIRRKGLSLRFNFYFISILTVQAAYFITIIWAAQRGAAFLGAINFLPVPLFAILLMQGVDRKYLLRSLVYSAFVSSLISMSGFFSDSLAQHFITGRFLSGFFQYSNALAVFLFCAIIAVFSQKVITRLDCLMTSVIFISLLLTNCRVVYVMMIVFFVRAFIKSKEKRPFILILCGLLLVAVAAYLVTHSEKRVLFILEESGNTSSFLARAVFWKDSLSMIIRHPFGTGGEGYYYLQPLYKTAPYTVRYAHSGIIELIAEVGIIPALMFIVAAIKGVRSKNNPSAVRVVVLMALLHSLIDFDWQYMYMLILIIFAFDFSYGKEYRLKPLPTASVLCALSLAVVPFGVASYLKTQSKYAESDRIIGFDPDTKVGMLKESRNFDDALELIEQNPYFKTPYEVCFVTYCQRGDYESAVYCLNNILQIDRYVIYRYDEHVYYLSLLMEKANAEGDGDALLMLMKEAVKTGEKLRALHLNEKELGCFSYTKSDFQLKYYTELYIRKIKINLSAYENGEELSLPSLTLPEKGKYFY